MLTRGKRFRRISFYLIISLDVFRFSLSGPRCLTPPFFFLRFPLFRATARRRFLIGNRTGTDSFSFSPFLDALSTRAFRAGQQLRHFTWCGFQWKTMSAASLLSKVLLCRVPCKAGDYGVWTRTLPGSASCSGPQSGFLISRFSLICCICYSSCFTLVSAGKDLAVGLASSCTLTNA